MSDQQRLTISSTTVPGKIWALVKPYWQSEEKGSAWTLLLVVVGMNLGLVYLLVLLNEWNNAFYNSLQNKDYAQFQVQLQKFAVLAFSYIALAVYQVYLRQMLQIRWRRWLTDAFMSDWLANRNYYRLELTSLGTDNPDQRIQEDVNNFTAMTLGLALDFMKSVVTLFSFVTILWGLSGAFALTLGGSEVSIPGYMVWVALVYAIAGTCLAHLLGRPLIGLNYDQQRYEADFRYGLVRLRENAEGVAFYRGEEDERRGLNERFRHVVTNFRSLMTCGKRLNWFTNVYDQLAIIFPFVVAAPRFFSGGLQLGGLMQTASAFGRVQDALSWFVSAYASLATWKATVDRLTSFHEAIQQAAGVADGIRIGDAGQRELVASGLDVRLPDGRTLLDDVATRLPAGSHVLVTGPSGVGKSTLFRALAGIWPFGDGRVELPAGSRAMFLPQRPYLPLGTLRTVVAYPAGEAGFSNEQIAEALSTCGLAHLVAQLGEAHRWSQRLSPGEQQRLAFARVLLNRPDWLFLDEATSALDEDMEQRMYALLRERLPETTLVSIAHRPTVAAFHDLRLTLAPSAGGAQVQLAPLVAAAH
jgi:putative ATP-binding cassette transporter